MKKKIPMYTAGIMAGLILWGTVTQAANPIITHKYTADPAAMVYIYYNDGIPTQRGSFRRSVCIDYLYYNSDGTLRRILMTSEGDEPAK
jgi:hypothetical protein